jgi:hypothetical protein
MVHQQPVEMVAQVYFHLLMELQLKEQVEVVGVLLIKEQQVELQLVVEVMEEVMLLLTQEVVVEVLLEMVLIKEVMVAQV